VAAQAFREEIPWFPIETADDQVQIFARHPQSCLHLSWLAVLWRRRQVGEHRAPFLERPGM
jgi:hypothetical protein